MTDLEPQSDIEITKANSAQVEIGIKRDINAELKEDYGVWYIETQNSSTISFLGFTYDQVKNIFDEIKGITTTTTMPTTAMPEDSKTPEIAFGVLAGAGLVALSVAAVCAFRKRRRENRVDNVGQEMQPTARPNPDSHEHLDERDPLLLRESIV